MHCPLCEAKMINSGGEWICVEHDPPLKEPYQGSLSAQIGREPWSMLFGTGDFSPEKPSRVDRKALLESLDEWRRGTLDDTGFFELEDELLARYSEEKQLVCPDYLFDWLESAVERHDRGVFLLQMEMGTGKTTFCRALDQLSSLHCERRPPVDCSVRAFYLAEDTTYDLRYYIDDLYNVLRLDNEGRPVFGGLCSFNLDAVNPRMEMAAFLNRIFQAQREMSSMEKLIVVLDGLGEIRMPLSTRRSIMALLPEPGMLDEGLYILLTARTDLELQNSRGAVPRLADLAVTESVSFRRNSDENCHLLLDYIRNNNLAGCGFGPDYADVDHDEALALKVLEWCGQRFVYLKVLEAILALADPAELENLPPPSRLAEFYLSLLERLYGKMEFHRLTDCLVTALLCPEPLIMYELAFILEENNYGGEETATFRLLLLIKDLQCFIRVSLSDRSCFLISAGHYLWIELVEKRYQLTVRELIESWTRRTIAFSLASQPWWEEEWDGATYLLAYTPMLVHFYAAELKDLFRTGRSDQYMLSIARLLADNGSFDYLFLRGVELCSRAVVIWQERAAAERLQSRFGLAEILICRGDLCFKLGRYEEGLIDYEEAIEIMEELFAQNRLLDIYSLLHALMNRATTYSDIDCTMEEMRDYERILEHIAGLEGEVDIHCRRYQAKAYLRQGMSLANRGRLQEAVEPFDRAIEIYAELDGPNLRNALHQYASNLLKRSVLFTLLHRLEDSLADSSLAVEVLQAVESRGEEVDRELLSDALSKRGITLIQLDRCDEALLDLDDALEVVRALEKEGDLQGIHALVATRFNRGNLLRIIDRNEEALEDFLCCRDMLEASPGDMDDVDLDEVEEIIGEIREELLGDA